MKYVCKLYLVLIGLLILSACGSDENRISEEERDHLLQHLELNYALWLARDIESYQFHFYETTTPCDGGSNDQLSIVYHIVVEDGEVVSVVDGYSGRPGDPAVHGLTIDEVFEDLRSEIEALPQHITGLGNSEVVQFDAYFGFPLGYRVEQAEGPLCAIRLVRIAEFN